MQRPSEQTVAVIGAGICGAAVAYKLSERGHTVLVLERNPRIADGVTSRNSGVIHAGLYYPLGSLKSHSCQAGLPKLYEWCEKHGVPHRRTGKWIVGDAGQEAELEEAFQLAKEGGAQGLRMGTPAELQALSGYGIQAGVGYFSSLTGIVDAYVYANSFRSAAEAKGAVFSLKTNVTGIEKKSSGFEVISENGNLECDAIVNCAGLYADEVHAMLGFTDHKIHPWRGDYFRLKKPLPCPHLIYPIKKKNAAGLGVHLTLELDGSQKLGPDVTIVQSKEEFAPPRNLEAKRKEFWEAAKKFIPNLQLNDIAYDTCGIRPKLRAPEDKAEKDFVLKEFMPGYIGLLGIESPGLTAAIDLADRVNSLLSERSL